MPEFVTERPTTVCLECERCHIATRDNLSQPMEIPIHYCTRPVEMWSVISGEFTGTEWAGRCHNLNTGDCPHFEAKAP